MAFSRFLKKILEKNLYWLNKLYFKKKVGVKEYQNVYEYLFEIALRGMNFGNGADISESGEKYIMSYINNNLRNYSPLIIFDAGANTGNYTKNLLAEMKSRITVYCFEPSPSTFERLSINLKNANNTYTYNLGFGDKKELLKLYTNQKYSDIASIYKRNLEYLDIKFDKFEKVQITTIDDFCIENEINRINLLKLDIEGNEYNALNGASEMIRNDKIDFIQFEFGGCNIDSRTYFKDFWNLLKEKYSIYRILKNGLNEVTSYNIGHEIFQNINYLAEKKSL